MHFTKLSCPRVQTCPINPESFTTPPAPYKSYLFEPFWPGFRDRRVMRCRILAMMAAYGPPRNGHKSAARVLVGMPLASASAVTNLLLTTYLFPPPTNCREKMCHNCYPAARKARLWAKFHWGKAKMLIFSPFRFGDK